MKSINETDINVAKRIKSKKRNDSAAAAYDFKNKDKSRNLRLVQKCAAYRSAMSQYLARIQRNRTLYLGRQWEDIMYVNGIAYREFDVYRLTGKNPMNINLIQPNVRNIIGQWRKGKYKPVVFSQNREGQEESEMMTVALQSVLNYNNSQDRDARLFEKFAITGMPIYKVTHAYNDELNRSVVRCRDVTPYSIIINPDVRDIFGEDINFIAEIHDYDYNTLMSLYSEYVPYSVIKEITRFRDKDDYLSYYNTFTTEYIDNLDCLVNSVSSGKARVLEIWQLEGEIRYEIHDYLNATWEVIKKDGLAAVLEENRLRLEKSGQYKIMFPQIDIREFYYRFWKVYHISLCNYVTLYESETPYEHNSHPYSIMCYPAIDGNIFGIVENLIDLQKLASRNIMLNDMLISTSAKNLLVVPKNTREASDITLKQIAEQWAKPDGVIELAIDATHQLPHQISITPQASIGINNAIQQTIDLIREISGVKDSILGNAPNSGVSGTLYAQETLNASLNTLDYIDSFSTFIERTHAKIIKLIKQYWTEKQYISIGAESLGSSHVYDPEKIRNFEFNNVIAKGENNPVLRNELDKQLTELLMQQYISLDMLLDNTSMPYADKLKKQLAKYREELQNGEMPVGAPQWLLAEYQNIQQQMPPQSAEEQALTGDYLKRWNGNLITDEKSLNKLDNAEAMQAELLNQSKV
ncbi:MAG: hypothetical protein LBF04_06910 [Prevotellaceae bacterium]|jgi:hypothetical protein|nr:hypothetical protein [Prevotellaceae bacterium]